MNDSKINLWVFKSVSDEDRKYRSIESYEDTLTENYVYDSNVANSKQVKEGDWAIIIDKKNILGFSKIDTITSYPDKKTINYCPECRSTNYETRTTRSPKYRCNKGHEFEEYITETKEVKKYIAQYSTFITARNKLSTHILRDFYTNNYNRNMSIQLLSFDFFETHFKHIPTAISENNPFLLSPNDAISTVEEPELFSSYKPGNKDEREVITRQIKARRGQKKFRDRMRLIYNDSCPITGCQILDILEAAHIKPYRSEDDNHPSNGLLLRADIHTLYDLNLIGIHPETYIIHLHETIRCDGYESLHGKKLNANLYDQYPSQEALTLRWEIFTLSI